MLGGEGTPLPEARAENHPQRYGEEAGSEGGVGSEGG